MEHHRYQGAERQPQPWKFKTRLAHCQIWEHCTHNSIAEAYPITNYESTHARINRNKPHVVNSLGSVTDGKNNRTYLLVQRIPNRFSEVMTLNESQTLKILFAVFKGLQELEENYGIIGLTQSCICFNEIGKVKIWVNSDLSSLHPCLPLKDHGNRQSRITYNMGQLVNMIQRKSFNSSFLKPFIRKLHDNKISEYWQAAEEILRIGELLFIVVDQKNGYSKNNQTVKDLGSRSQNQKLEHGDSKKGSRKEVPGGHVRKFSNHEPTNDTNHRRYQSFVQNQHGKKDHSFTIPASFTLNFNKFAQSQAFDALVPPIHKSAPLSPRQCSGNLQQQSYPSKRSSDHYTERKEPMPKQGSLYQDKNALAFHKKNDQRSYVCETIKEDNSQFDDSFSHNLKVDEKQILMSGEFQTFGILEDLSETRSKKKASREPSCKRGSKEEPSISRNESEFDIHQMDLQIQKRLEKKQTVGTKQRTSIDNGKLHSRNEPESKPSKLKTMSYYNEKENVPSQKSQCQQRRDKSPMTYIDKKYQEYIYRNQMAKNGQSTTQEVQKAPSRHSKHTSNLETLPLHCNGRVNSHSYHNYAPQVQTSRNHIPHYRIPTDR